MVTLPQLIRLIMAGFIDIGQRSLIILKATLQKIIMLAIIPSLTQQEITIQATTNHWQVRP
jgi:hypothetical protein